MYDDPTVQLSVSPQKFYGAEIIDDYIFPDFCAIESEEEVKARKLVEKEKKKHPRQKSLFSPDQQKYLEENNLIPKPDEELLNDLPF